MRKKFIILLLTVISTLCLAVGLSACGSSSGSSGGLSGGTEQSGSGGGTQQSETGNQGSTGTQEDQSQSTPGEWSGNEHNLTHVEAVEATCTTDGNIAYWYCADCDTCFSDSAATNEIDAADTVIPATGHTASEAVIEDYVAPTCSAYGSYVEVVRCAECDTVISRETYYIPSTGHSWNDGEITTAPTCTETGVTTYTCTTCGETKTEAIAATGHTHGEAVIENEIEATCTEDGSYDSVIYCTVCNGEVSRDTIAIPATGHTAGEATTENYVAATCTQDGSCDSVIYCTVCNEEVNRDTIAIPATGHSYVATITEPTCTEQGYTTYTCSDCGDTYIANYVEAKGHSWNDGEITTASTCTETGEMTYTCTICDETKTETIAATGHNYKYVITEPTCTEEGYTTYTCSNCDDTYIDNYTEATGHNYELSWTWSEYTSAEALFVCKNDESHIIKITANITSTITKAESCEETGLKLYTATVTLDSITYTDTKEEIIPATGHTYENGICTICGLEEGASYGLSYTLSSDGTYYSVIAIGTCTDTELIIPSIYNFLPVTTIAANAFSGCISLTSVTVPESVTSIESNAFGGCSNLVSITLPFVGSSAGNAGYTNFGYIFGTSSYRNNSKYVPTNLKTVIITTSSTSIGSYAFYGCSSLATIIIGNGVIGERAFYNCTMLENITINDSVTSIGEYAFYGCKSLESVYYCGTVSQWLNILFSGIHANPLLYAGNLYIDGTLLTDLKDTGITSISAYAFAGWNITSLTIPESVTSIGDYAFYGCTALTEINFNATAMDDLSSCNIVTEECNYVFYYAGQNGTGITVNIGSNVTKIPAYLFFSGPNRRYEPYITSVIFEDDSVCTDIGSYAFSHCTSLTSITIPTNVTTIDIYAFDGCYKLVEVYNLSSLTITAGSSANGYVGYYAKNVYTSENGSSNLTSQDDYIFYNDNGTYYLMGYTGSDTELTLPALTVNGETVNYIIYQFSFFANLNITGVTIPDNVTSIGDSAFWYCDSLTSVTIPNSIIYIDDSAFWECSSLTSVYYSGTASQWASITFVSSYSNPLYYAGNLYLNNILATDITLEGITSINALAFYNCTSLTSITIGSDVTSIGESAFSLCSSITTVTIGNNVTSIGRSAFSSCTSLTSITIPNSVTTIDGTVFYNCTSLANITMGNNINSIGFQAFYKTAYYNDSSNWTDNVLYIGTYLIVANTSISGNYEIKDGTTFIASYVFNSCKSLTSITIPDSVIYIDSYAFSNCTSLESVTIPDSVETLGDYVFYNCTALTSVIIPDSVIACGDYAFRNCTSLTSVTIGDSVETIGSDAFSGCTSLESVTIGSGVTSIGSDAFYGCTSLTSITVSNSNTAYKSIDGNLYDYNEKTLIQYATGKADTSFTIPNSVTSIGRFAFYGCTSLTSITISNSVTSIGSHAFYNCTALTSVTFENTSGWYVTTTEGATSGTDIDVTVTSTNATYLTSNYYKYYWYRGESES